jgi:hypothetical protein
MPLARLGSEDAGHVLILTLPIPTPVIPAHAGTHSYAKKPLESEAPPVAHSSFRVFLNPRWVPASAGMTFREGKKIASARIVFLPAR